jgi:hypothetical protein
MMLMHLLVMNRRTFTKQAAAFPAALMLPRITDQKLVVTDIRIHEIKVNARGNWHFVELKTNKGHKAICWFRLDRVHSIHRFFGL